MQGSSMRHADLETLRASMVDKKIKVMSESCSHNSLWQRTNKKRLNRRRNPGSSVTSEYKRKKTNKLGCMRMQLWTFSCKKNERKLQRADLGSECLHAKKAACSRRSGIARDLKTRFSGGHRTEKQRRIFPQEPICSAYINQAKAAQRRREKTGETPQAATLACTQSQDAARLP
jgi:hypothetical protein